MKENYQHSLEKIISELPKGKRPTLLLHSCCGPCSSYVLSYLASFFDITVYFYNPNILPKSEYILRLNAQKEVIQKLSLSSDISMVIPQYDPQEFLNAVKGLENEPERGKRCTLCMDLRIQKTAAYAKEKGFDYFCTTLSVSPHKHAELLYTLSQKYSATYGVSALPADFKKKNGFLESTRISKELGIYRQNYCGCIFSKRKSDE